MGMPGNAFLGMCPIYWAETEGWLILWWQGWYRQAVGLWDRGMSLGVFFTGRKPLPWDQEVPNQVCFKALIWYEA